VEPAVYAIATLDTKSDELAFVAECLRNSGVTVKAVDVGTEGPSGFPPDVTRDEVLNGIQLQHEGDRGRAVTQMGAALADYLVNKDEEGRVAGVIGIGGSGGTALITTALRRLPIGLPKLMVSTVASGDTSRYVDCSDIMMMYSVVDIAGLNVVSEKVLSNAAHAMAGMVSHKLPARDVRPCLGLTMFGVTTPCVTAARQLLEAEGYDCLVFHATGTGGRAMEKLVDSGMICGVLDLTTTEVADEIAGGIFPAGDSRFDILIERQVPLVLSLGAVDMVNFGPLDSVPARYRERNLHVHNPQITLMRTTPDENRQIARWIANKLNKSASPFTILIPEGGVSMLDAPGQPFHDPEADAALFTELEASVDQTEQRRIVRLPYHINDQEFSQAAVAEFLSLVRD
jgi:uncharacterized protein (UPF0261 family)